MLNIRPPADSDRTANPASRRQVPDDTAAKPAADLLGRPSRLHQYQVQYVTTCVTLFHYFYMQYTMHLIINIQSHAHASLETDRMHDHALSNDCSIFSNRVSYT